MTPLELGSLLGYQEPVTFQTVPWMVPCPILRNLLIALGYLEHKPVSLPLLSHMLVPPPVGRNPQQTYLPALRLHMDHSWQQSVTASSTSVKNDDAVVPIHLWNRQITAVFSVFHSARVAVLACLGPRMVKKVFTVQVL